MKNFRIENFTYEIICDEKATDTAVTFEREGNALSVLITANADRPRFVTLKWGFETEEDLYVLGDAWERSYGEFTYSESKKDHVIQYIINQKEHHRRVSIREEMESIMKEFGIEYDERYI